MPIGAAIGGAVVTAGGAVLGASAQKKAAKKAAGVAADNTAANNALTREIYGQNAARLDPFVQGGLRAQGALQGLLFGSSTTGGSGGGALGGTGGTNNPANMPDMRAGLQPRDAWAAGALQAMGLGSGGVAQLQSAIQNMTPQQQQAWAGYLQSNPDPDTVYEQRQAQYRAAHPAETAAANAGGGGTAGGANGALSAWDQFRNSTNYQFRFNQGNKALQMSALPTGGFDSGQTRKALVEYGQNFASNELGNYMDRLAQQQSFGLGGASALAGVSQNMVGQVTANNNNAAGAAANAALVNGSATANMWGGIAGALGNAAGNIWGAGGSSYGGGGGAGSTGGWSVYGGT